MTGSVGGIMRQSAQCECIFVEIARFLDEGQNKITASHVMREIAEEWIAERVIAQILDDCAAISVGVGLSQLRLGRVGESAQEYRLNAVFPRSIDNGLVGENGISGAIPSADYDQKLPDNCATQQRDQCGLTLNQHRVSRDLSFRTSQFRVMAPA